MDVSYNKKFPFKVPPSIDFLNRSGFNELSNSEQQRFKNYQPQKITIRNRSTRVKTMAPDDKNLSNEQLDNVFKNLEAKEFKTKNETIKYLGTLKNSKARAKLFELIETPTLDARLRIAALDSAARGDKDSKLLQEFEKLAKDPQQDKEIRRACITHLSGYRDTRLIGLFTQALTDEYRFIRVWAVRGLLKIPDHKALVALIKALGDEDEEIRKDVQEHLETKSDQIVTDLIKAFRNADSNKFMRYAIAGMLGRINSPDVIPALIAGLNDGNDRIVSIAIRGLGKQAAIEAIAPMINLVKENESRAKSVEGCLVQIGQAKLRLAIKTLAPFLVDKVESVRALVESVMQKIGPQVVLGIEELFSEPKLDDKVKAALKSLQAKLQSNP